jgi:hypothetical protein
MAAAPCLCGALAAAAPRRSSRLRARAPAAPPPRSLALRCRAASGDGGGGGGGGGGSRGGGFVAGLLVGGTVFGALGLLFAPQISAALLRGRDALRLPRFGAEGDGAGGDPLEAQRANLNEKIAELNAAIDEFSLEARLGAGHGRFGGLARAPAPGAPRAAPRRAGGPRPPRARSGAAPQRRRCALRRAVFDRR